jgi:hypothetical protein
MTITFFSVLKPLVGNVRGEFGHTLLVIGTEHIDVMGVYNTILIGGVFGIAHRGLVPMKQQFIHIPTVAHTVRVPIIASAINVQTIRLDAQLVILIIII